MIVCLKTRFEEIHIVSWSAFSGWHRTLCGKSFGPTDNIETFACNDIFRGMCPTCSSFQKMENDGITNHDLRGWQSDNVGPNSKYSYMRIQRGWLDINHKYQYDNLRSGYWDKLHRMRRKFPSKKIKAKSERHYKFPKIIKKSKFKRK